MLTSWLAYKTEKRQAYKPVGLQAMLSKAVKLAGVYGLPAVCGAMETAMANGWHGWDQRSQFEDKQAKSSGGFQTRDDRNIAAKEEMINDLFEGQK